MGGVRFERFCVDFDDRRLTRDGETVELNARYFDALALLLREPGRLVTKERFFDEVWGGVPVTDEALTQCVRTLRRRLDDDAGRPRFIETVPKHGYRFIAPVELVGEGDAGVEGRGDPAPAALWAPAFAGESGRKEARSAGARFALLGGAAALGGALCGVLVGLFYGLGSAQAGGGATSALLVLVCLGVLSGAVAAAGVGFGIAAAGFAPDRRWRWSVAGGALGGLVMGGAGELLGLDAFNLLFGRSPADMTGAPEGAVVGAAVGLAAWLAGRWPFPRALAAGGAAGALAGVLITLLGGRLLGGSLELLARGFPESRFRLDRVGALFGESGFGPLSQGVTAALEAGLFGACVVGAITLARRRIGDTPAGAPHATGPVRLPA